jgi:hypothetical protein
MRVCKINIILTFFLFTFLFPGCVLFRPSAESLYHKNLSRASCYDIIIVPGAPVNSAYSRKLVQMRVAWAVHLYKLGVTDKILMSGAAVSTPYKESVVMKQYAISMGVPAEDIYTEEKAQHTTENIWYGYHQAKELGCDRIAVATDAFQTKMIYGFSKRKVPDIAFLPLVPDTLSVLQDTLPKLDLEPYKIKDFVPLNKKQNRIERFRGTCGKHINYNNNNNSNNNYTGNN